MKCPICKKDMIINYEDHSYNTKIEPHKEYVRTVYWCKQDDVWVSKEIPLKK